MCESVSVECGCSSVFLCIFVLVCIKVSNCEFTVLKYNKITKNKNLTKTYCNS